MKDTSVILVSATPLKPLNRISWNFVVMKDIMCRYAFLQEKLIWSFWGAIYIPFLSDYPSLMLGIAIHCIQHSQAMLERGVCELAHSFFHYVYLKEFWYHPTWPRSDPLSARKICVIVLDRWCTQVNVRKTIQWPSQLNLFYICMFSAELKLSRHSQIYVLTKNRFITQGQINSFKYLRSGCLE